MGRIFKKDGLYSKPSYFIEDIEETNIQVLRIAARSGLSYAIRRGDFNLAWTCFKILWEDPESQKWLKWRFLAIVAHECWFMTGEVNKFVQKDLPNWEPWWKMLETIVSLPGGTDVPALCHMTYINTGSEYIIDDETVRKILEQSNQMLKHIIPDGEPIQGETKYQHKTCYGLSIVAQRGGLLVDQASCAIAAQLMGFRNIKKADIFEFIHPITQKPIIVMIPWFVFDGMTGLGQEIENHIFSDLIRGTGLCRESLTLMRRFLITYKNTGIGKPKVSVNHPFGVRWWARLFDLQLARLGWDSMSLMEMWKRYEIEEKLKKATLKALKGK
jgi:hypothetical protein